jgi:hypothetical protein
VGVCQTKVLAGIQQPKKWKTMKTMRQNASGGTHRRGGGDLENGLGIHVECVSEGVLCFV